MSNGLQSLPIHSKNEVHYNFQNQTCIWNVKCMCWVDTLQNVNVSIRVVNALSRHDILGMSLGNPINYYCSIYYLTCIQSQM
jgi:hypothetical protein